MFKIESYVTPILLSYVDKYVKDFKPVDAQVSLWGGGVVLHNLVLKADVLQQELSLPFTLVSGRIHELLIQVPWTKIMSEPIVVTIDTIECVLNLRPPADESRPPDAPSRKTQVVEAPPGYMQALVRRIVSNIVLRVHHLIVKYVEDDIVLSLNVKHLQINSADAYWQPSFADIDQSVPVLRRLVTLEDLTLCLDRADSDGKIRFFQEPLLYRCQLTLRILTCLVSPNMRRASNLSVQIRSSKLAWGASSDQLTLLLRILKERPASEALKPPTPSGASTTQQPPPTNAHISHVMETAQAESWSEWAWSWVPTWVDRDGEFEEVPQTPSPVPIQFFACFDSVSLVFKMMESEGGGRKRARGVLEACADKVAVRGLLCAPTLLKVAVGVRTLSLRSQGKCVCGHANTGSEEPTIYLRKLESEPQETPWEWPEGTFDQRNGESRKKNLPSGNAEDHHSADRVNSEEQTPELPRQDFDLWAVMAPMIFLQFIHDRFPPQDTVNPYDNPPTEYEYSDWIEDETIKIRLQPMELVVSMDLVHRIVAIQNIFKESTSPSRQEIPKEYQRRTLTVEECEALLDNLPQRRMDVELHGLALRLAGSEHASPAPAPKAGADAAAPALLLQLPSAAVLFTTPLYPHRVCSAASQIPQDTGAIWQGARMHVSATISSIQLMLVPLGEDAQAAKPVARAEARFVFHLLLKPEYFEDRKTIMFSYNLKIREINVCGSAARMQVSWHIIKSFFDEKTSPALKYTSLPRDSLFDEDAVAMDMTIEDISMKGFVTRSVNTHIFQLKSIKATAFHKTDEGELKQAWLFSGPDVPTTTPYMRVAVQWCSESDEKLLDYIGVWTEPTAAVFDPLFTAWLAYKPQLRPVVDPPSVPLTRTISSSVYFKRRRATPPSSSGRGVSRSGSGAEMVHSLRPRSHGSSSEPSERKETKPPHASSQPITTPAPWWEGERLLNMHTRLRRMLLNVELGLLLVYVPLKTASALDCATVRDAMERHVSAAQRTLVISLGRVNLKCNATVKHLWQDIRHDGPTYISSKTPIQDDSFPWKMQLADMSCYTMEVKAATERYARDKSSTGLHSHLKIPCVVTPQTVLELVTTTVTLTVVTKSLPIKTYTQKHESKKKEHSPAEERMKYFKTGVDFKPTTLKEFVRGPATRIKTGPEDEPKTEKQEAPDTTTPVVSGPVVSLGVNVYADTPPVVVRLNHEQVYVVASAIHCFRHILTLMSQPPLAVPRHGNTSTSGGSHRSLIRSFSELEEQQSTSEDTQSESRSELVSIFESPSVEEANSKFKTFFWFQWVVSRATLVVVSNQVKLAFEVDDIISTIDLQTHYNQLKVKVASASVKHYERTSNNEWSAGSLGGRVLEAREPTNAKEDNHFLAITITQAQISNLPASWKEELHPKILQSKGNQAVDSMWEIYATLAPLEAVIRPTIIENVMLLMKDMPPRAFCSMQNGTPQNRNVNWQWPFIYVITGGMRLLVHSEVADKNKDDTFLLAIGKVEVTPHPENPICRRAVTVGSDNGWMTLGGAFEGRQYECYVKSVAIHSVKFKQLVNQEASQLNLKGTGGENPALKWTQPSVKPVLTPVLHTVEVGCVVAPALYYGGLLACGPALELNLMSDCAVELSIDQLRLCNDLATELADAVKTSELAIDEITHDEVCPYEAFLLPPTSIVDETVETRSNVADEAHKSSSAVDSGVDTATSYSNFRRHFDEPVKKTVAIAFADEMEEASDHLEVFVTMGIIELSLYILDDSSPEVIALRPPSDAVSQTAQEVVQGIEEIVEPIQLSEDNLSPEASKSITDTVRNTHLGKAKMELRNVLPYARKREGMLSLIHATLHQPNLYYWKKKSQKNLQVSLFNAWVGLGSGQFEEQWSAVLASTTRGVPDPVTDIPPALATMKLVVPTAAGGMFGTSNTTVNRGTLNIDIERPLLFTVSEDRLRRIISIVNIIKERVMEPENEDEIGVVEIPVLYKIRQKMMDHLVESITIQSTQIGVSGEDGAVGWESFSLQVAAGSRPERLNIRAFICALLISLGPPDDRRHPLLHPMMLGAELEASWDAWRRVEGTLSAREPLVRLLVGLDRVTLDVRPEDLCIFYKMKKILNQLHGKKKRVPPTPVNSSDSEYRGRNDAGGGGGGVRVFLQGVDRRLSATAGDSDISDHYYKDDLRSGAFKILSGNQLPMAYQVVLHASTVSWRYPHPRAITRIVAFPLPDQDTEVDCVLEHYSLMLARWEPQTHFKIPVSEPREINLQSTPPDANFAQMWRFRVCENIEESYPAFEFNLQRFTPRLDPLLLEQPLDANEGETKMVCGISAEQLSGVLRVDSYFAPRLMPRIRSTLRMVALEIHAHNSLPLHDSQATSLEGYYVSKPLMKSHRVLSLLMRDSTVHGTACEAAGAMALLHTHVSSEVLECTTGTIEQFVEETRVQVALSLRGGKTNDARVRFRTSPLRTVLHVPRIKTLQALASDWKNSIDRCLLRVSSSCSVVSRARGGNACPEAATASLEGRVSLWLHNSTTLALRVGQDGTDQLVPLGPAACAAYRWRCPNLPKVLRFALASPSTQWQWSTSIPFKAGSWRVRLMDAEGVGCAAADSTPGAGVFLHARGIDVGARRSLLLTGRLTLANMLRFTLLFKVRARCPQSSVWRTVCSGELGAENVGKSVLCGAECELVLKIKFVNHETGWSGDIPLKECPKENVPWLVKVPSDGDIPYVSVWCRVVRARSDGRILATVWPLYVLHSHLPLDTDVLMTTETGLSSPALASAECHPPPLIQSAPGRGACTHLLAPGTTSARHNLTFQYRNIECPVTKEAVPLHYGVTDTSVFEKRAAINNIDEVVQEIKQWLERAGRDSVSTWPYSVVAKHWPDEWKPALLQPRSDVTVRYSAVRAGGGCCLQLQLCPVALLCNASSTALTLRAHDAAPLCRLEPGAAVAPPSAILQKPFFMSVEVDRETFVSGQLEVWREEPGVYGAPPPGRLALDRPTHVAIPCGPKVALLSLYYEIKEYINVLGISSTYILINKLPNDLLVSAIAIPKNVEKDIELCPKTFLVVSPLKDESIHGLQLCRFNMAGRWRGGEASELRPYLCLALPAGAYPAAPPVPLPLCAPAPPDPAAAAALHYRRAIALRDARRSSVPIVVTQQRHEGRWVVTVARDPCPQLVVHNRTRDPLALAQPRSVADEPSTSRTVCVEECPGVRWHCVVEPNTTAHYSTPAYCARFPLPADPPPSPAPLSFITIAFCRPDKDDAEEEEPEWCAPVALTEGEQLLQLPRGSTVKLRVTPHPHSTLLELQDVDNNDISASEIRRRLLGPFPSEQLLYPDLNETSISLERVDANEKLLEVQSNLEEVQSTHNKTKALISEINLAEDTLRTPVTDETLKLPVKQVTVTEASTVTDGTEAEPHNKIIDEDSAKLVNKSPKLSNASATLDQLPSAITLANVVNVSDESFAFNSHIGTERDVSGGGGGEGWRAARLAGVTDALVLELRAAADTPPLLAAHVDRAALLLSVDGKGITTTMSISELQIDNLQYESGQFDFAVIACTRARPPQPDAWPPLWSMLLDTEPTASPNEAHLLLRLRHDQWTVGDDRLSELTEVEVRLGPLSLFVEDACVSALAELARAASGSACGGAGSEADMLAEARSLAAPLRLRTLLIHPLHLTLTLHTAVRMYIALDQSPLRLGAFKLQDMMTSADRLTHALTVHYLSAAILGAGWVVGGLELLGAPGALAARVGGASGGVRGVAAAAAAALLRSLSAAAGSLARNLDLLAGDEEHARRAAAARRRPPATLLAGLAAGITNFAINILGAVGGLAHHPLVSVAVGEAEGGAMALRRGLLGALAKPLSATADLVALAGHGLLHQTGWDPVPQWRGRREGSAGRPGWRRDCVRWTFRLAELCALTGFESLLDDAPLQLLLTHKFLVIADPETERIVEMIDLRFCSLGPYQGPIIELSVTQRRQSKSVETKPAEEEDDYQLSAAAMARVARYTGAGGAGPSGGGASGGGSAARVLRLLPAPGFSTALHAALAALLHHNADTHLHLM